MQCKLCVILAKHKAVNKGKIFGKCFIFWRRQFHVKRNQIAGISRRLFDVAKYNKKTARVLQQYLSKNEWNIFRIFHTFVGYRMNHLCNIERQRVGEAQIKMEKWKNQNHIFHFRFLFSPLPQLSLCLIHTHISLSVCIDNLLAWTVSWLCLLPSCDAWRAQLNFN